MSEAWCDLCDLPLNTCIHGRPPTVPPAPTKRASPTTSRRTTRPRSAASGASPATRSPSVRRAEVRRTRQSAFRPFILAALQERGGSCEVDELMDDVHERMSEVLLEGDHDTIGRHEVRWRYAARFERKAMTDDGLMEPARTPGVWELTRSGLDA